MSEARVYRVMVFMRVALLLVDGSLSTCRSDVYFSTWHDVAPTFPFRLLTGLVSEMGSRGRVIRLSRTAVHVDSFPVTYTWTMVSLMSHLLLI